MKTPNLPVLLRDVNPNLPVLLRNVNPNLPILLRDVNPILHVLMRDVNPNFLSSCEMLTLIRAALKKSIDWRLQVQIAFWTEVNLAPSRPE
jgi:hypothetical protein